MSDDPYIKIALEIKTRGIWDPKNYSLGVTMYQADQEDGEGNDTAKSIKELLATECKTSQGSYAPETHTITATAEGCKVPQIGAKEPMNSAKKLLMIAENAEGCTVSQIPFTLTSTSCNAAGIGSLYRQLEQSDDQLLKNIQVLFENVAKLSNTVQSNGGEATLQTTVNLDLSSETQFTASAPSPLKP